MSLDIVKGLAFLKQHNIIHRDLKTDNIFVTLNERKEIARCLPIYPCTLAKAQGP